MSKCLRKRNKGFSLLELIMAVAILSIGITAVLQAFSFCAQTTALSCDIIDASFLAQDLLQELEAGEGQGEVPKESVEGDKDRFTWKTTCVKIADRELYKLDMRVNWRRQRRLQELEANTYFRP